MPETDQDIAAQTQHYLATGEYDMAFKGWPGDGALDRIRKGSHALSTALVAEVKRRGGSPRMSAAVEGLDLVAFGRRKLEPMVRGLFSKAEQKIVLPLLERSVVFVTPETIEPVLMGFSYHCSAWTVANMYLGSVGAELLGPDAPNIVGFSEEQTCYVSPAYFEETHPFADFVVHEAAHIFHNSWRRTVGLPETRNRKYILHIDFLKQETFAYACEAYSRILERNRNVKERRQLAQEFDGFDVSDERVDATEVAEIVRAACERRNGWKVILARCAGEQKTAEGGGSR